MTDATGKISKETMQMAQTRGMQLGGKINTFLQEKGYYYIIFEQTLKVYEPLVVF